MRKRKKGKKLSRKLGPRKALLKGLIRSLIQHERIITTLPRAKTIRPKVEKLITKAKQGVKAQGELEKILADSVLVKKLIGEIGPRFSSRPGGYTRILKLGPRRGDSTEMAVLEFVGGE